VSRTFGLASMVGKSPHQSPLRDRGFDVMPEEWTEKPGEVEEDARRSKTREVVPWSRLNPRP
jgi:hypothetical protein